MIGKKSKKYQLNFLITTKLFEKIKSNDTKIILNI